MGEKVLRWCFDPAVDELPVVLSWHSEAEACMMQAKASAALRLADDVADGRRAAIWYHQSSQSSDILHALVRLHLLLLRLRLLLVHPQVHESHAWHPFAPGRRLGSRKR